jgi:hypothetical protein
MKFSARSWGRGTDNLAGIEDAGFAAIEGDGAGVELRVSADGSDIEIWMTNGIDDGGGKYERLIGVVRPDTIIAGVPGFTPGEHLPDATTSREPIREDDRR